MRPVRTAASNFVWMGPTPDIGNLHAQIDRGGEYPVTTSVWEPTPEEREAIARNENVALRILGMHPPVSLYVTDQQGVGEDRPEIRERLRQFAEKST